MKETKKPTKKVHTNPKFDKILQIISQYEADKDHAKVKMWRLVLAAAQARESREPSPGIRTLSRELKAS